MAEDIPALMARAMCGWHHNHNGGPTPCNQAKMEADAVLHYLSNHGHTVQPIGTRFVIEGDDIKVWVNDVLVFEGVRKMLAWDDPDGNPARDVTGFLDEMWRDAQDATVQERWVNGVPEHETVHMTLDELKVPPGLRPPTDSVLPLPMSFAQMPLHDWRGHDSDMRITELLRDAVPEWPYVQAYAQGAPLTAETIYAAIEKCQRYPMMLPDYMQVHVLPPNPRVWADRHVRQNPTHIVIVAGQHDVDTQCFYPEDCKATMWNDPTFRMVPPDDEP